MLVEMRFYLSLICPVRYALFWNGLIEIVTVSTVAQSLSRKHCASLIFSERDQV